ncbi:hypothetical protein SEA_LILMARTIN_178 [Streptomyces phage LilMartin]|nr:hypothetical protein SEA_LILMARTIN_178 [Streptomyces phage LilMartin]QNO12569.1 hypothetical protein SEA_MULCHMANSION_179 [Streptomyces phage MulchMansion]UVK61239.1 hypothetical protein SEA_ANGELA_180 [Streptomyces phage Angela]
MSGKEALICNRCGLIGTTNKKESDENHRKFIKEHEPDYVTPEVYFGEK